MEDRLGRRPTDHGLDRGAASELAFDDAEHTALLTRDEDAARIWSIVTAVSLVDVGAFDLAAGEFLGAVDRGAQRMAVVRVARQRPACSTNWPPGARRLVVTMEAFTPNS